MAKKQGTTPHVVDAQTTIFDYIEQPGETAEQVEHENKEDFLHALAERGKAAVRTYDHSEDLIDILRSYGLADEVIQQSAAYYAATEPLTGAPRRDNALLHATLAPLLSLQYSKEGTYGDSWAKRGELGIFFNIGRKFDRLENIILNGARDEVGESEIDTIADMANYALLWLTHIMREHPDRYNAWLADTQKEAKQ